ncbi:MAG: hypothetical protein ACREBU_25810 [Nitrososphaera sp.]
MSPDMDMVLLTPDEINRFISTLRVRYNSATSSDKNKAIHIKRS